MQWWHVLASRTTHEIMLGLPGMNEGPVEVVWQPWPLKSLIYAWASAVGPVYLVDAANHCVLAKMHLETPSASVLEGPWQMVVQAPDGDGPAGPYYDDELWKLYKTNPWARNDLILRKTCYQVKFAWKPTGTGLVLIGILALGYVSFAAT